jgi:hypothetical protein
LTLLADPVFFALLMDLFFSPLSEPSREQTYQLLYGSFVSCSANWRTEFSTIPDKMKSMVHHILAKMKLIFKTERVLL